MASGTYRGQQTVPMQHYPFTNPPAAQNRQNPLGQHPTAMAHPRLGDRTSSAPSVPILQQLPQNTAISNRPRPPIINPATNSSSQSAMFKDDTSLSTASTRQSNPRSLQPSDLNSPALQTASYASVAKSAPDRYRRNHRRAETSGVSPTTSNLTQGGSAIPSGSGMATVGHLYTHPTQTSSTPMVSTYPSYRDTQPQAAQGANNFDPQPRLASKDDLNVQHQSSSELAKRYRRRSISSIDAKDYAMQLPEGPTQQSLQRKTYAATLAGPPPERKEVQHVPSFERPSSAHGRNESSESSSSVRSSSRPSSKRGHEISSATSTVQQATPVAKNEAKIVNVPPRGSSDATKRLTNPSPLSKPMPSSPEMPHSKHSFAAQVSQPSAPQATTTPVAIPESPAAQHLAALNKKDGKKEGKSSRLRRAFSFGSAAELRKASAENSASNNTSNERAKLRKDRYQDEQEAQQAAIAQKQEAAGLGEGIYSGQGQFFTGSTDNLSISSTASSASVMIRKMGKGVKKGSRSLVGLFRPKSVVGVPAADSAVPEPSMAQVSMVTVEAEREKVNVNANPHDQVGGGTGFPKLERNSMDAASLAQEPGSVISDRDSARPRPSIVGGERERAEVLAAVKKGILKRRSYCSPPQNISNVGHVQAQTQATPRLGSGPWTPKLLTFSFLSSLPSMSPHLPALQARLSMITMHAPDIAGLTQLISKAKSTFSTYKTLPMDNPRACQVHREASRLVTSASVLVSSFMILGQVENMIVEERLPRAIV